MNYSPCLYTCFWFFLCWPKCVHIPGDSELIFWSGIIRSKTSTCIHLMLLLGSSRLYYTCWNEIMMCWPVILILPSIISLRTRICHVCIYNIWNSGWHITYVSKFWINEWRNRSESWDSWHLKFNQELKEAQFPKVYSMSLI